MLADHVDRRACAVTGALFLTGGLLLFGLGGSFGVLAVACVVIGVADTLIVSPLEAALAEESPDRLDKLIGTQHALAFVGDLFGPLLLGIGAATAYGWRFAFVVTAGAMLAFAALLAVTPMPRPGGGSDDDEEAETPWRSLLAVARRRDVLALATVEMLLGALDEPFSAFVLARTAGELSARGPEQLLGAAGMVGGIAGSLVVSRLGASFLVRRVGPWLLAAGALLAMTSAALPTGIVAMGAVGLGMALLWAGIHHRLLTILPGRVGAVSAASSVIGGLTALSPVVGGTLADWFGLTAALGAFAGLAVVLAVVAPRVLPPVDLPPGKAEP